MSGKVIVTRPVLTVEEREERMKNLRKCLEAFWIAKIKMEKGKEKSNV